MKPSLANQKRRQLTHSLNLSVILLASILIVVLVNAIVSDFPFRKDITQTRRYSLSPQTETMLKSLDQPVKLISLFDRNSTSARRVSDLLNEYQQAAPNMIATEAIDPVTELAAWQRFTEELNAHYAEINEPRVRAIQESIEFFKVVREFTQQRQDLYARIPPEPRSFIAQFGIQYPQIIAVLNSRIEDQQTLERDIRIIVPELGLPEGVTEQQAPPLPNINAARLSLLGVFSELRGDPLDPAQRDLKRLAGRDDVPDALRGFFQQEAQAFEKLITELDRLMTRLNSFDTTEYDWIRDRVLTRNSLVVRMGDRMGVLTFDQIFAGTEESDDRAESTTSTRLFRGEEAITGLLYTMIRDELPLIVFANQTTDMTAIRGNAPFSHVADALRNMNFEVVEWHVAGRQMMGGMLPPSPMPEPKPGQKMVMIVLPTPPPQAMTPGGNTAIPKIAQAMEKLIAEGGSFLIFTNPTRLNTRVEVEEPLFEPLRKIGINPKSDRLALQSVALPDGGSQVTSRFILEEWPNESPLSSAVRGLRGRITFASPIEISDEAPESLISFPLFVTPAESWAEVNPGPIQQIRFGDDPDDQAGPITLGIGAELDQTRMIVIGDPFFAENEVTRHTSGSGKQRFISFPANTELFLNSIYWLAEMEELIAASPRSQDIPRIQPMPEGRVIILKWLIGLGLPLLVLGSGIVVWLFRRS